MFKVKLNGLNEKKAEFASLSAKLPVIVDEEVEAAGKEFVARAKRDAPKDQGTLVNGISYKRNANGKIAVVSNAFYSPFVEFGTKGNYTPIPGTEEIAAQFKGYKGGDIQEMLRMIVRWVHRKQITGTYSVKTKRRKGHRVNQYAEDYAVAWPIMMSILKHGIRPHPFFFKQMDVVWPQMIRNIERRIEREGKVRIIMPGNINHPKIVTI